MQSVQVWTDYPTIFFLPKPFFGNLIEFPTTKIYSKFNIFHRLGLKICKSPSLNPTHEGLPSGTKSLPKFLYTFSFDLNEFSVKILFNIQSFFHLSSKHYETISMHLYSLKAFQQYQECGKRCHGLGDLNMTNKNN